jgi:hypothetical protein
MSTRYGTESASAIQDRIHMIRTELAKKVENEYGIGSLADSTDLLLNLDGELAARTALEQIVKDQDATGATPDELEDRLQVSLGSLLLHASDSTSHRARLRFEGIRRVVQDYRWAIQNAKSIRAPKGS